MYELLLDQLQRARRLPLWSKYAAATAFVLAALALRIVLHEDVTPFLTFMPVIPIAAFLFDRGTGVLAAALSAAASYFGVPDDLKVSPSEAFTLLMVGGITAAVIEVLTGRVARLEATNRRLRQDHALLEGIVEGAPGLIFAKDLDGRFVVANTPTARALEAPGKKLPGLRSRDLMPVEQAGAVEQVDREVMETGQTREAEELVIGPGGSKPRWYLSTKAPWRDAGGRLLGLIGVARDIHERKLAENRLRTADSKKTLLLADANHRFKNGLQAMAGLLRMDGRRSGDARVQAALENAAGRLKVLAQMHDGLGLAEAADATDGLAMRGFLEALVMDLRQTVVGSRPVALLIEVAEIELAPDAAGTLGLIVNEAVTNALKHAFPGGRSGTVWIRLNHAEVGRLRLGIADDGIGPAATGRLTGGGGGTRLLRALARQLGGEAEWRGPPGAVLAIDFPARDPG